MSDNLGAQPGGHLLGLPTEVRLLIYEKILSPCKVNLVALDGSQDGTENGHLAILATCRTIYTEAKPILHENTKFHIGFPYAYDPYQVFGNPRFDWDPPTLQMVDQKVRPLLSWLRKLSIVFVLTPNGVWDTPEDEDENLEDVTAKLTLLGDAPQLKEVHITFQHTVEVEDEDDDVADALDDIIGVVSRVLKCSVVSIAIDPSLQITDFQPSSYFDKIAELNWVDTTHETFSNKLKEMSIQRSDVVQELRAKSSWVATKSTELRDFVNNETHYLDNPATQDHARLDSANITAALRIINTCESQAVRLRDEIAATKRHLEWFERTHLERAKAKAAASD